jgi:phospholipid transport system substrate-binding protein
MQVVALVLVTLILASPALAAGPSPTRQLEDYSARIYAVLDDPALQKPERKLDRREAVRRAAVEMFDAEEAARRALGVHWRTLTPDQRKQFVPLFLDLLERSYTSKVDAYGGQRLRFTHESVDGDYAVVRGFVMTAKGTDVPAEARLVRRGDRWLVYDVTVENLSLIANYRAQFDRILRTSSYQELVRRLESNRDQ